MWRNASQVHCTVSLSGLFLALVLLGGCAATPLLQAAEGIGPALSVEMPDARAIETVSDDGTVLRGWLVSAGNSHSGLLVLHLLPSGIATDRGVPIGIGGLGLGGTIASLGAMGYDSVVFDYRGLGASDGRRRSDRLLDDGRAMWQAAVEMAGGRSDQVILRAGSLGTLIAADLLEQGMSPAATVLYAPVRAETILSHGARDRGGLAALFAPLWYRTPRVASLEFALSVAVTPVLLILPEEDAYLSPVERKLLLRAAADAGHDVVTFSGDHRTVILRAWGFTLDESSFSGRRTPELSEAERTFLQRLGESSSR